MGYLSIDMLYGEAVRRIFAYGKVPIKSEVHREIGEPSYESTVEHETVGFAYDWVTNRVYRVTEWNHEMEALPPVGGVCGAVDQLMHHELSEVTDIQFVSTSASSRFDPMKELD